MTTEPTTDTAIEPTPNPGDEAERTSLSAYVREHPAAFIAGGVVLGLVIGALAPKKSRSVIGKRALAMAATAGEIGLAASRQMRESAGKAAHEAKDIIDRVDRDAVREKAGQIATVARDAGAKVAERASTLASRLKH